MPAATALHVTRSYDDSSELRELTLSDVTSVSAPEIPSGHKEALLPRLNPWATGHRAKLTRRDSDEASVGVFSTVGALLFVGFMVVIMGYLFRVDKRRGISASSESEVIPRAERKPPSDPEQPPQPDAALHAGSRNASSNAEVHEGGVSTVPQDTTQDIDVPYPHGLLENAFTDGEGPQRSVPTSPQSAHVRPASWFSGDPFASWQDPHDTEVERTESFRSTHTRSVIASSRASLIASTPGTAPYPDGHDNFSDITSIYSTLPPSYRSHRPSVPDMPVRPLPRPLPVPETLTGGPSAPPSSYTRGPRRTEMLGPRPPSTSRSSLGVVRDGLIAGLRESSRPRRTMVPRKSTDGGVRLATGGEETAESPPAYGGEF
ncbi:hypothetical protein BV20DRAFT_88072 [Pilatotrama ljubarskyi]|nr:hypothetical protein BV20DRAFT_88072 [Pilatotrama ljubarskyi]